jgi:hypothetical protein
MVEEAVGSGEEGVGQGQDQMGRLPQAVEHPETQRPQELVVSLQMHDRLTLEQSGMRASGIWSEHRSMNRKVLFLVNGALVLATVVLGYQLYQDEPKRNGVVIGERGVAAEKR